jgi:hypothetical protein
MRRCRHFRFGSVREGDRHARGRSRLRHAHRARAVDELRALAQVGGIDEGARGHRDEPVVAHVAVAVRESEASGFGKKVRRLDRVGAHRRHVEALELAQDLQDGDATGRGRRHATEAPAPIDSAERVDIAHAIAREILQGHRSRIRMPADRRHDVARDLARVESIRAFLGDRPQCGCKLGIAQHRPGGLRLPVGSEEVRAGRRLFGERREFTRLPREPVGDRKALLRELDHRLEERGPGELSVARVRDFQQPRRAGHAHRTSPDDGRTKVHRLPVLEEKRLGRARGRGLARVVAFDALRSCVEVEKEGAAAEAGRLRFDERQHELGRDHRVDGVAAAIEHAQSRVDRERVPRGDHVALGFRERLRREADGRLGLGRGDLRGRNERRREEKRREEAQRDYCTPPTAMYFSSRKSSMPYLLPSRPRPDCLTPPKGATSVEMIPTFTPTIPASSASAARKIRPTSRE